MPTLYISEFQTTGNAGFNTVQAARQPAMADQPVTISSVSAQSAAFNEKTSLVRVQTDTACFITFGTNPTATTSKTPIAVNVPEYFAVPVGEKYKIAAITV